ncbi:hypothetical protein WICPIJ_001456 [Wickerhamomyces pijperi]|uniref:Uncharacterized protein n=1 Tax=Wickerhamomyces pijperi TaxID=599730 RepID=A0A9P8QDA0_WICPI|nr:hypothetical protein WICPIJ_001456 [Wickerhamomyces pijperi]
MSSFVEVSVDTQSISVTLAPQFNTIDPSSDTTVCPVLLYPNNLVIFSLKLVMDFIAKASVLSAGFFAGLGSFGTITLGLRPLLPGVVVVAVLGVLGFLGLTEDDLAAFLAFLAISSTIKISSSSISPCGS